MGNPEEIAEIREYVRRLIAAAESGEMVWKSPNPTTYSWDTPLMVPQLGRLTLQRVEHVETRVEGNRPVQRKSNTYVLQAFELRTANAIPRTTVNGSESPELNTELEKLFEVISSVEKRRALDFLKSIVPKT